MKSMNTYFQTNIGVADRIIRIIIAIIALVIAVQSTGNIKLVAGVVSALMMITAITGFCWLYKLMGIQTCPRKHVQRHDEPHAEHHQGEHHQPEHQTEHHTEHQPTA